MRHILLLVLMAIVWPPPAEADEPRTFFGKTVEGWRDVLRDKASSEGARRRAIGALGAFGPEAKFAEPELLQEARGGKLAREAVGALTRIGAGTAITVPFLMDRFVKQGCFDPSIRNDLARIGGAAVPALVDLLKGPDTAMRVCAAEVLGYCGAAARPAVPWLIRAIEHPDDNPHAERLRESAITALGQIGTAAKEAVPVLNALLEKSGGPFDAVLALAAIGAPPARILRDEILRDGDPSAVWALAWLGPEAREAAPALRGALADKHPQVRFSAAAALAHVEPRAPEAVPVLVEALKRLGDEELDLREVPSALAHLGPQARAALPVLIDLVKQGRGYDDILRALVQIDPEGAECVPALIAALKSDDDDTIEVAADCLGLLGPRAAEAVPAIAQATTREPRDKSPSNRDYGPRESVIHALRRIGPAARPAIPALIAAVKNRHVEHPQPFGLFKDSEVYSTAAAAQALGAFGAHAKAAVPALIEAVKRRDEDDETGQAREAAILALGQIGPEASVSVPALRSLMKLDGHDSEFQPHLIVALAQLTPDGKALADEWLANGVRFRRTGNYMNWPNRSSFERRAVVLGALGRTSLEADWLTRDYLESMERIIDRPDPRQLDPIDILEGWFAMLSRLGPAGHVAIPRLNEWCTHPNPWVRMWAREALEKIAPMARP